jgi:hypothetical protein
MVISQEYADKIKAKIKPNQVDHTHTGKVKGKLRMLYPTAIRSCGSAIKWVAYCECGRITLVVPSNKHSSSCGCVRSKRAGEVRRKLKPEQVIEIRESKDKMVYLAALYGVSYSTIHSIKTGRRYADVKKPQ